MQEELKKVEQAVLENRLSPFQGAATLLDTFLKLKS